MVRFQISDCDPRAVALLQERLGVGNALAQTLVRRGHTDPDGAQAFLDADERHSLEAFPGLIEAARLIVERAAAGARITIHGDYDVDGVCATAVLVRALRSLGAQPDWYLPDRAADGYGLRAETVRRLHARGTELLITVDCGITAVEEVALARALGIETVVTDHHRPRSDGALPDAPIVHPGLSGHPCADLCAAAVAHKLAQACHGLAAERLGSYEPERDLDLVALATIADVVPLLGENRSLTRRGLCALASSDKPGVRALMRVSRVDPGRVDERAVGFALAPRINAAGRLYRADAALELLLTTDDTRAAFLADELDRANSERRGVEQRIRQQAEAQIARLPDRERRFAYVLGAEGWHPGVVGIVASRLAELHRRPVVLVCLRDEDDGCARGSGRGVQGYDLLAGLTACAEHLRRYGGHSAAAGVELERGSLGAFAAALDAHAATVLDDGDDLPRERVDAVVGGRDLGMELAEELARLAPFGRANPTPTLLIREAVARDVQPMGEGRHARFRLEADGVHARAVCFGCDGRLPIREGESADASFALEINEWRGVSEARVRLRHARSTQPVGEEATLITWQTPGQAQSTLFQLPEPLAASAAQI